MRLSEKEKLGILEAIHAHAPDAQLYLYGSRVDDTLRGGDIDLLLLVETDHGCAELRGKKHHILSDIKSNIGDQKIDLLICTNEQVNEDPFLSSIFEHAVLLESPSAWGQTQGAAPLA